MTQMFILLIHRTNIFIQESSTSSSADTNRRNDKARYVGEVRSYLTPQDAIYRESATAMPVSYPNWRTAPYGVETAAPVYHRLGLLYDILLYDICYIAYYYMIYVI